MTDQPVVVEPGKAVGMSTPPLTVSFWPAFNSTRQKGASPTAMDCR
ncbi:hypothetical protein [Streptomyces sp. NPDC093089]